MLTSGYPGRDDHIAAHRQLHAEAGRLIERWQGASVQLGELVEFMVRRVVAHHIMTFDRAFAQHQLTRQAVPF
jgi:hemerythrin